MRLTKGNFNISYIGSNFEDNFGNIEVKPKKIELIFKTLGKDMLDKEILEEFKPEEITLDELAYVIKNNLLDKNGYFICYVRDTTGVLWAVECRWNVDGWVVGADSVEDPGRWDADNRVFSRNFSGTKKLESFESLTLRLSNLESDMDKIKKIINLN